MRGLPFKCDIVRIWVEPSPVIIGAKANVLAFIKTLTGVSEPARIVFQGTDREFHPVFFYPITTGIPREGRNFFAEWFVEVGTLFPVTIEVLVYDPITGEVKAEPKSIEVAGEVPPVPPGIPPTPISWLAILGPLAVGLVMYVAKEVG